MVLTMLTEVCQELRNWFDRNQPKWSGEIEIKNGALPDGIRLQDGQYYRIIGSAFNDGVHRFFANSADLVNENKFMGSVWAMAVPPAVIALVEEIDKWNKLYGQVDGVVMSPYASESFGGYTYMKSGGVYNGSGSASTSGWRDVFKKRMNQWRKI